MKKYYEILGLDENASFKDVKKQYKTLARKLHPDKGGSTHLFNEIQLAYEKILSDKTNDDKKYNSILNAQNEDFFAMPFFRGLRELFHGKPEHYYSETVETIYQNDGKGARNITKRIVDDNGKISEYWY